jgi:hypothetical protein
MALLTGMNGDDDMVADGRNFVFSKRLGLEHRKKEKNSEYVIL